MLIFLPFEVAFLWEPHCSSIYVHSVFHQMKSKKRAMEEIQPSYSLVCYKKTAKPELPAPQMKISQQAMEKPEGNKRLPKMIKSLT